MAEKKQKIFINILTRYLSDWWSTLGALKEEIDLLPKQFKNTKAFVSILGSLLDAYTVAIANTEALLEENLDIDFTGQTEKTN